MTKKNVKTYPVLQYGTKGDLVVMMKDLLSKFGSSIKITENFDIGTKTALKAFQKKNGLEVTGICDTETWSKLLSALNSKKAEKKIVMKKELTLEEKVAALWNAHPELHP